MPQIVFFFAVGIFSVSFLPQLPPWWLLGLSVAVSLCCCRRIVGRIICALCIGIYWGTFCGQQLLEHQLPPELELRELLVDGVVIGLPDKDQRRSRFQLQVNSCHEPGSDTQIPLRKLLLSWYHHDGDIQPGQRWQLRVKLRRPRGFANPAAFDYQQWLLQQGISATGYVRKDTNNQWLDQQFSWPDSLRYQLRSRLQNMILPGQQGALIQALVVGDGSALSATHWALFKHTGTAHLMVISGLHIGLFSLFCYGLGSVLGRLINLILPALPAALVASVFALFGALFYAALSGFGLPAQRALVMVGVILLVRCLRGHIAVGNSLLLALAVVAVLDPLAIHSTGFWLSFGAVFGLLWVFSGAVGRARNIRHRWRQLWLPQWTVFVSLSALLLAAFGQLPLLSVPINSIAIPWISLLIVPLCLLGVSLMFIWPSAGELCWQLAGWQLQWLYRLLDGLQQSVEQWQGAMVQLPMPWTLVIVLILVCCAWLMLLPRGVPGRWLAAVPFTLAFLSEPQRPLLTVTVLDVGQGLAVVVNTESHTLVYDTGAKFSDRFDVGSGVIAPFLRSQGIMAVDRLLVSHGDGDHAGGVTGLLGAIPATSVWSGEPLNEKLAGIPCRAGMSWRWDDVTFEVLSPATEPRSKSNNRSCVLLVSYRGKRLLLPGDVEARQERWLLRNNALPAVDILLAPHHGSRTSSTAGFVLTVDPEHVIYSAGYRHQFGHPHKDVVNRYAQQGSKQWNTAISGAITATLVDREWHIEEQRKQRHFFWQRGL